MKISILVGQNNKNEVLIIFDQLKVKFSATKSTHQSLKEPYEVRKLRRTEHVLLQKYTNATTGRYVT